MLLITGCSGGGGTNSQSPPAAPQPPPTMPEPPPVTAEPDEAEAELRQEYAGHPEFRNQPALEQASTLSYFMDGVRNAGNIKTQKLFPDSHRIYASI